MENKKQWIKPQLIILGRGTPEELVLTTCKRGNNTAPGPRFEACNRAATDCLASHQS
jgi:hypothetical protein